MLVVSPAICKTFTAGSTYNTDKARTAARLPCCVLFDLLLRQQIFVVIPNSSLLPFRIHPDF